MKDRNGPDAVAVVVLRRSPVGSAAAAGDDAEVLLLRRAGGAFAGAWTVVMGGVEDAETGVDAARRELHEETGLALQTLFTAGEMDAFYDPVRDRIVHVPFFVAYVSPGDVVLEEDVHDEHRWVTFREAAEMRRVSRAAPHPGRDSACVRRAHAAAVAHDPGYERGMSSGTPIAEHEVEQVESRQRPRSAVIFETIRRDGEDEYGRASLSLFLSAIAAGGSMTFSMVTMGVLQAHLPDGPWRHLVASFGYTVGFLIVILGRQQLFTENTLTPLLPFFYKPTHWRFRQLVRLWTVILAGNLIATVASSAFVAFSGAFSPDVLASFDSLARTAAQGPFLVLFTKAIFAGWLIALMVWLLPLAETAAPFVIIVLTYVIAAGGFGHIIAGSVDVLYGAWHHAITWSDAVGFLVPTLLGNCVGGVALVAAVSSGEIATENDNLGRNT